MPTSVPQLNTPSLHAPLPRHQWSRMLRLGKPRPLASVLTIAIGLTLAACAAPAPWVPLRTEVAPAEVTLLWVGRGECERFEDGVWVRRPEFDYEFSVEQRRNQTGWESLKSLRRLHPEYDGSAGPRTQTYYFEVAYDAARNDRVTGTLRSSLGEGTVQTDREFRQSTIDIRAAVSTFAPFDRYHIAQRYHYEQGELDEVIELRDGQTPWVRNHERARLFGPAHFETPPTRRN